MKEITIIMPSFNRPQRTRRAIRCILNQKFKGHWQALIVGDCCPVIAEMLESGEATKYMEEAKMQGNSMAIFNLPIHYGNWGYQSRTTAIKLAFSHYTIFFDNDDIILPTHLENYYSKIEFTDNEFMAFCTKLYPIENADRTIGKKRVPEIENGKIGYQEIIVKTEFLKRMPPQDPVYNADWHLIQNMVNTGARYEIIYDNPLTHMIMGVGELREQNID